MFSIVCPKISLIILFDVHIWKLSVILIFSILAEKPTLKSRSSCDSPQREKLGEENEHGLGHDRYGNIKFLSCSTPGFMNSKS